MYKFSTNLLRFLYVICVAGAPNFLIFQNINDSEFKVTANRIETTNGANFTLICKISSNNDEKLLDSDVVWSNKRKGKTKFSNINNENDSTVPDANILNFASVTAKDEGKYACKSLQYKHFRMVQLIVRNEASDNIMKSLKRHKEHKRDTTDFKGWFDESDKYFKILKEEQDREARETEQRIKQLQDDLENQSHSYNHKRGVKNPGSVNTVLIILYIVIALVVIIALIYGIIKCYQKNSNNRNSLTSSQNANRYRSTGPNRRDISLPISSNSNGCSHTACNQNRIQNEFAPCLRDVANGPSIGFSAFDSDIQENNLNVPPSYADSTANSATNSTHNLHTPDYGFSTRILDAKDAIKGPSAPTYEDADDDVSTRFINPSDGFNTTQPPTYEDALENTALSELTKNNSSGGGGHNKGGGDSGGGSRDSGARGGDSGGRGDGSGRGGSNVDKLRK